MRAPRTTVPVLEHGKTVIQGSGAILDYVAERLGKRRLAPRPEASDQSRELEALADLAFGLGTQRIFYATLLRDRKTVVDLWTQRGPAWGRAFYGLAFPLVAKAVGRMYKTGDAEVEEAKDRFRRAMDETDRALRGRPFLLGDTMTRADVTVASLLAPACRPPQHPFRWPASVPGELDEFLREFEGRPTWDFVLRMYRDHRVVAQ